MIKSIISGCAVLTLSTFAVTHAELSFEQELQQGCNKVKKYASLGKKNYDQKQYKKALENFKAKPLGLPFVKPMKMKPQLNLPIVMLKLPTIMWA